MLLELCIAIALVALFSSILGLKTYRMLEKHAFEKGVTRVETQIIFCQKISLTHQMDMVLLLTQKKEGLFYLAYPDEDAKVSIGGKQEGIIKELKLVQEDEKNGPIKIRFSSTGATFPKTALDLVGFKHPDWKKTILVR